LIIHPHLKNCVQKGVCLALHHANAAHTLFAIPYAQPSMTWETTIHIVVTTTATPTETCHLNL